MTRRQQPPREFRSIGSQRRNQQPIEWDRNISFRIIPPAPRPPPPVPLPLRVLPACSIHELRIAVCGELGTDQKQQLSVGPIVELKASGTLWDAACPRALMRHANCERSIHVFVNSTTKMNTLGRLPVQTKDAPGPMSRSPTLFVRAPGRRQLQRPSSQ